MAEWSELPLDLWGLIAERLGVADLIRFSSVCKSWRSMSGPPRRGGFLPWLIVPYGDKEYNNSNGAKVLRYENFCCEGIKLGVFSLHDRQVYRLELPEVAGTRICGSSPTGWLATVQDNSEIKLVHALTRSQFQLPPLTEFPYLSDVHFSEEQGTFLYSYTYQYRNYLWSEEQGTLSYSIANETYLETSDFIREFYIDKLVLTSLYPVSSAHPDVVIAIHGGNRWLALFRPTEIGTTADKSWIALGGPGQIYDVTYYGGRFYAVNNPGNVYVIDGIDSSSPHLTVVIEQAQCLLGDKHYLVESSGELLIVSRFIDIGPDDDYSFPHKTTGFEVFKLDLSAKKCVEVKSLGDHLLFVGYNSSFSVSTIDIPSCCRSNCIYFTDDHFEGFYRKCYGGHDSGVFNLDDGTIEPCYPEKETSRDEEVRFNCKCLSLEIFNEQSLDLLDPSSSIYRSFGGWSFSDKRRCKERSLCGESLRVGGHKCSRCDSTTCLEAYRLVMCSFIEMENAYDIKCKIEFNDTPGELDVCG